MRRILVLSVVSLLAVLAYRSQAQSTYTLTANGTSVSWTAPVGSPTPTPLPTPSGPAFYVAVNGSPAGDGSEAKPWDLQTGLNANIPCGATLYRRGGVYRGKFTSNLKGCSDSNPIRVKNYPGEWSRIDGYDSTRLAVALDDTRTKDATVVLTENKNWSTGTTVQIGTESLLLWLKQPNGVTWKGCERVGAVTAHAVGDEVWDKRDTFDVGGQYTHYYDLEVFSSSPLRSWNQYQGGAYPMVGIKAVRPSIGIKIINPVLHDNAIGVFSGTQALGFEVYGGLIYNTGWVDWGRGHGQPLYQLNESATIQKRVRNTITLNSFSDGMKNYSESNYSRNFLYENIISFNNGVLAGHPGNFGNNGSPLPANWRYSNIFAGTGNVNFAPDNIEYRNIYLYHPFDAKPEGANLGFGYLGRNAVGLKITNSRIMGGNNALNLRYVKDATITGNKIYAQTTSLGNTFNMVVSADFEPGYTATVNNNEYRSQIASWGAQLAFSFSSNGIQKTACDGTLPLKFSDPTCPPRGGWREHTGFDSSSVFLNEPPKVNEVFVIPNEYESGRAHIAIYNWQLLSSVTVNVSSFLNPGDRWAFYPAEAGTLPMGTPFQTGTVSGSSISIRTSGWSVAAPIGLGWTPGSVAPQFVAGVIKRVSSTSLAASSPRT